MANLKEQIKVYKNVDGALSFSLGDIENPSATVNVSFSSNDKVKRIRMRNIVTLFEEERTLKGLIEGIFLIEKEDLEKILKVAEEEGVYVDEDSIGHLLDKGHDKFSAAKISEFLRLKRMKEIEDIINSGSRHQKELLLAEARKQVDSLTKRMVDTIEEGLKISITGDE